jgi:molybdopterin converting factor small subunit
MIKIKIAMGVIDEKQYDIDYDLIDKDITLEDLIADLKINKTHIGGILLEGKPKRLDEKIKDNSEIYILPLLGGG